MDNINALPLLSNNLFITKTVTPGGNTRGIISASYVGSSLQRIYNNIINVNGVNSTTGFLETEPDYRPSAFAANYFTGPTLTFNETDYPTDNTAAQYDVSDGDAANTGDFQGNQDIGITQLWVLETAAGGSYADLDACRTANGGSIFECDLHPAAGSDYIDSGISSADVGAGFTDTSKAVIDFDGNCRDNTTGNFSVGPYEDSANVIPCP